MVDCVLMRLRRQRRRAARAAWSRLGARAALTPVGICCVTAGALAQEGPAPLWLRQFGATATVWPHAAASDENGLFITGEVHGDLVAPNAGRYDIFLVRYDATGNHVWARQFGTIEADAAYAATSDGQGGVYIGGGTQGNLAGPASPNSNAWLARYSAAGDQLWIRQFGMWYADTIRALASDGTGGVYVAGTTRNALGGPNQGQSDIFIVHYDREGNQLWIRQFGSAGIDLVSRAMYDGAGGLYIGGLTQGDLGGGPPSGLQDAFLARYDSQGNQIWVRQFGGSPYSGIGGLADDGAGGVLAAGGIGGLWDDRAFVTRYTGNGERMWYLEFGPVLNLRAMSAAPDGAGGVFIGGRTEGPLGGPHIGAYDAFLARYDGFGDRLWITQFGTPQNDEPVAVASDHDRGVYIVGSTRGSLGGPFQNSGREVFIGRFPSGDPAPCYANCDGSSVEPILNIDDFTCFINEFAQAHALPPAQQIEHYANCDASTTAPVLNVDDFTCFINWFAQGCR